jgi:hypothetical protein
LLYFNGTCTVVEVIRELRLSSNHLAVVAKVSSVFSKAMPVDEDSPSDIFLVTFIDREKHSPLAQKIKPGRIIHINSGTIRSYTKSVDNGKVHHFYTLRAELDRSTIIEGA